MIENHRISGLASAFAPEHDIWEQLQFTHSPSHIILSNRLRLEQRFISKFVVQDNAFHNNGYVFANRFRYAVKSTFPMNGQNNFHKGMYVVLQNEVFINVADNSNVNGNTFDQNRVTLGIGCRFNKNLDVDFGYMNQYIKGRNNGFTNNHILQCTTNIRL